MARNGADRHTSLERDAKPEALRSAWRDGFFAIHGEGRREPLLQRDDLNRRLVVLEDQRDADESPHHECGHARQHEPRVRAQSRERAGSGIGCAVSVRHVELAGDDERQTSGAAQRGNHDSSDARSDV